MLRISLIFAVILGLSTRVTSATTYYVAITTQTPAVSHTYTASGNFMVTLTVTNSRGENSIYRNRYRVLGNVRNDSSTAANQFESSAAVLAAGKRWTSE